MPTPAKPKSPGGRKPRGKATPNSNLRDIKQPGPPQWNTDKPWKPTTGKPPTKSTPKLPTRRK